MRPSSTAIAVLALVSTVSAQALVIGPGVTIALPNPNSQGNTADGALMLSGRIFQDGIPLGLTTPIMTSTSLSTTTPWLLPAPPASTANDHIELNAFINAFPESPFTLAGVSRLAPSTCCPLSPWLPGWSQFGTLGQYHLGRDPVAIVDGLGLFRAPDFFALTNGEGGFPLAASLPLGTQDNVAFQAVVVDATAPEGLRLTAAYSVAKFL